jgi:hypothetical protein
MIESDLNLIRKLEEKRKAHYLSLKENKDKSHEIVGEQIYSKQSSHFIFELIQNAEDEEATEVNISLNDDSLIFEHNGTPFSIQDIEAITTFGNNEKKKLKANAIGRFGIGFKSVFYVTESPEIHSGYFNFRLKHYIIPEIIDGEFSEITRITLPFKKKRRTKIIRGIEEALSNLDYSYLLFLNNIKTINWETGDNEGRLSLKSRKFRKSDLRLIEVSTDGEPDYYISIKSNYKIGNKNLLIKIASRIIRKRKTIIFEEIEDSPLFAFFPTEKDTSLPFLIHAPFLTTAARDNITEDIRNDKLIKALSQLFIKKIEQLQLLGLINLNTWRIFPCNSDYNNNEIYDVFYESLLKHLHKQKTEIIPTQDKNLSHIKDVMFFTNSSLPKLLDGNDIISLFKKSKWLFTKSISSEISHVKDFFQDDLSIPSYGLQDFCEIAKDSFFKSKEDNWLIEFYNIISDNSSLWITNRYGNDGVLRYKKFIRTATNKMVAPFDRNGIQNVYLPSKNSSEYPVVKSLFTENKSSRKLFTAIGLKRPNIVSEAIQFAIPRITQHQKIYSKYKNDLDIVLKAFRKSETEEEEQIIEALKEKSWLPAKNPISRKIELFRPEEIYYPNKELKTYLGKTKTAKYLETKYLLNGKYQYRLKEQFQQLGLFFIPRRYYLNEDDVVFENNENRNSNNWNDDGDNLEGLKEFLSKKIDKRKSILLWNILLECRKEWGDINYSDTEFIQLLKKKRWVFDKYNIRRKPDELTISELDEAYGSDLESGMPLHVALEFAEDEIREFEESHGVKAIPLDEFEKLKREKEELEEEIKRLKAKYEPSNDEDNDEELPELDDVDLNNEISDEDIDDNEEDIPDGHQGTQSNINGQQGGFYGGRILHGSPTKRQQTTGNRGEEYVFKLLQKKYQNDRSIKIKELNKDEKIGIGCDFIIEKDNEAHILVEVKSTEGGYENTFSLSKKQWAEAIKSHINSNLVPYHVYCVYYARSKKPKHKLIKDPIDWMLKSKMRVLELPFWIKINE